jgi:galactokinase
VPVPSDLIEVIQSGGADAALALLYGDATLPRQRARYAGLLEQLDAVAPGCREVAFFSAPGRTEVGGNHTDHNGGRVLAAAVNLDAIAAAAQRNDDVIHLRSEGYGESSIDTRRLSVVEEERGTVPALLRGVCAGLAARGWQIGGFDACVTSDVLKGSGLSSSAAFEVLAGSILNGLYNGGNVDPLAVAQIGQYAENVYFGKPCGLMDQTASSLGGFVTIDFRDAARPVVQRVAFDFAGSGHALVIVDTGGDHADLTPDYAAVRGEMQAVATVLGGQVLRDVSEEQVLANIPRLRTQAGDRAILRALHFFEDDRRVAAQAEALEAGRLDRFLELVRESGRSSWMLLQNCYPPGSARVQGVTLALALSERLMRGRGAWRVHGGGFAGTIQAFVPHDLLPAYLVEMRSVFGSDACHELSVRQAGAVRVL